LTAPATLASHGSEHAGCCTCPALVRLVDGPGVLSCGPARVLEPGGGAVAYYGDEALVLGPRGGFWSLWARSATTYPPGPVCGCVLHRTLSVRILVRRRRRTTGRPTETSDDRCPVLGTTRGRCGGWRRAGKEVQVIRERQEDPYPSYEVSYGVGAIVCAMRGA